MRAAIGGCFLLWASLAAATACAAQGSLELAAFGGLYVPTSKVLHLPEFEESDLRGQLMQHSAPAVGVRVTAWVDEQVGLDLSLDHSGSQSSGAYGNKASFLTGSARFLLGLNPRESPASFSVALGLARVNRRGAAAYSSVHFNTSSWGPVVGAVSRFRLWRALALRAELDDYVYFFPHVISFTQHDLVLSVGVSTALYRAR